MDSFMLALCYNMHKSYVKFLHDLISQEFQNVLPSIAAHKPARVINLV